MRDITPPQDKAPDKALAMLARDRAERRADEFRCATHYLLMGHDEHASVCIFDEHCSRDYDPDEAPVNLVMYEGTGLAALYDLPGGDEHAWQLAGWNVRREQ